MRRKMRKGRAPRGYTEAHPACAVPLVRRGRSSPLRSPRRRRLEVQFRRLSDHLLKSVVTSRCAGFYSIGV